MSEEGAAHHIGVLRQEETEAFFEADAASFGERMSASVRELLAGYTKPERVLVSRDDTEVVGAAVSEPSIMTVPGLSRLAAAMVVAVFVLPTHRRQGRLTALMGRQLNDLREEGNVLATLYASEGGIYGRFGYGMSTFGCRYEVDKRVARLAPAAAGLASGKVRLVDRAQAAEAFAAVYAEYAPTRAGEIDRNELGFLHALGEPGGEELSRRFYAVYEQDGRIDGYLGYELAFVHPGSTSWSRRVICHELCHLTTPAYVGLWQFMLGIDLTDELRSGGRPVDEPIRWLLTDPRQLQTVASHDRSWLRLVDVQGALAGRGYPHPGTLVVAVGDESCSWNAGRYRVHVSDEWAPAEVERTSAPADLELDVSTLASIYLGGVPPSAFRVSGRVTERTHGALALADRMFANDRPPFCLTSY